MSTQIKSFFAVTVVTLASMTAHAVDKVSQKILRDHENAKIAHKHKVETAKKFEALQTEKAAIKGEFDSKEIIEDIVDEVFPVDPEAGKKEAFVLRSGDANLTLGGRIKTEYIFTKNAVFLNEVLPDEMGYFKTTADMTTRIDWGQRLFGHKAFDACLTMRHKTEWGVVGRQGSTDSVEVKIGQTTMGKHQHPSTKPLIWMKDAWIQLSLNAVANCACENIQYLKAGYFPFKLGRGIALGEVYGSSKEFLGVYNRINDFSAPGILLTGTLLKDIIEYDLYYAKLDEKSSSSRQVLETVRENQIGRRTTPWRGVAKDDELWAGQLRFAALNGPKHGTLRISPYVMWNEASARKVEVADDAKSQLGTAGVNLEYEIGGFEIGTEVAGNFGHELLYAIDRNKIRFNNVRVIDGKMTANPDAGSVVISSNNPGVNVQDPYNLNGIVQEAYSHIVINNPGNLNLLLPFDGTPAPATKEVKNSIVTNTNLCNNGVFSSDPALRSKADRFRPSYRNNYAGWMAVFDMAYTFKKLGLKVAFGAGYASGDRNPHIEEVSKSFKGFVGINESYTGKLVHSIMILDERIVKRPLTVTNEASGEAADAQTDQSFGDLFYIGAGTTWKSTAFGKNWSINPNMLFFFKDSPSPRFDLFANNGLGAADPNVCANRFLGTEINMIGGVELLKDVRLFANFATFIPGSFYTDVRGAPLENDIFNQLEEADQAQLPTEDYRISDHPAYLVNIGVDFRF